MERPCGKERFCEASVVRRSFSQASSYTMRKAILSLCETSLTITEVISSIGQRTAFNISTWKFRTFNVLP